MTLNVNHQLTLLSDILSEQTGDSSGEISEYQQIKRLVQSLIANNSISDEALLQILPEIYNYGRIGEIAQNMEEHITTNKNNIDNWLQAIGQINVE